MTSSSFVSPLDCLTSFLGISLSRAVSSFGLPVYSSIHSRRITKCPKIGHYGRVVFPKLAEAAGNARGVPNVLPMGIPMLNCEAICCLCRITRNLVMSLDILKRPIYPFRHWVQCLKGGRKLGRSPLVCLWGVRRTQMPGDFFNAIY